MNNTSDCFIGIDISTTATKAILIDKKGTVLNVSSSEYTYKTPFPLWSEQDPALWWQATIESIHSLWKKTGVSPKQIKGIGLTGQMHGLVILDEKGHVLRPSILWNDQRTQKQCEKIRKVIGKSEFIQLTGNDALAGFTAPKILWVKEEEPGIFDRIQHVLLPKDYIRYKLTNRFAIDRAGGSGTVLFDLAKRDWSPQLMDALGLKMEWFPPTFEGTSVTGQLTKEAASTIGLIEGIPVFGGGGDQAAAAVGTGAVEEGIISISLGTSGVVFATTDSPFIESDGRLHAFCHAAPGKWHLMGVMLSAAGSLRWFRDTFQSNADFNEIIAGVQDIPAGSEGLLFMPYLTGERTPYPDPLARGSFVGFTVRHTFQHFTRSVLEGVAFGLRDSFELMKEVGLKEIKQVRVTGGGAKNPTWRQIIADVLNSEIVTVSSEESAAFGAALLAATGVGIFGSIEEACSQAVRIDDRVAPGGSSVIYEEIYPEFRKLYPALKSTFHIISDIV